MFDASLSDEWDNKNELTAVCVKDDGSLSRKPVGRELSPYHHLAPRQPVAFYDNELIYSSYNRRNAGRSTYKLGLIKIK